MIDALNHITSFAYDNAGNQTSMTDANSHTTQFEYDENNRRTRVIHPDSTTDQTGYDELGRIISKTDQGSKTTQYQYDKLGRLTKVIDALNQETSYTYDQVGNRLTQTDANNHTTTFEYDRLGRRTRRTLPLGQLESYTYDLAGNLKTKTDFNGKTTNYSYDAMNRLLSKVPDPSLAEPNISFTYTQTGQRKTMTDASGATSYIYDSRDRLFSKATPFGTLSYTYNETGNLSSIRSSNAGGVSVDYIYDVVNRLVTAKDNRLANGTTTYNYDDVGNLASYLYPNGVQHTYTYNTLNRLTNLTVAPSTIVPPCQGGTSGGCLASYTYTLGPAGNRTAVAELSGRRLSYAYDDLYRLKSETITADPSGINGTIGYTYDPVGNRQSRTSTVAPLPAVSYAYDANDRLVADTYDNNGNTMVSGGNAFTFNFENRLTTKNGNEVTMIYDGDGNRVANIVGGVRTQYLVDDRNLTGYAQVLEEIVNGTIQRVYTYGLNRISQSQASGTSFYGYDGHGNVRILTDTTGAVTDRYDYDAFGNIISQTGTTPNVYLYSGEQLDPNVGFYYLRDRYYNIVNGRFTTNDPFEGDEFDPSTLHKYLYSASDPVNRIDPSGQAFTLTDTLLTVNIIATVLQVIDVGHQAAVLIEKARSKTDAIQASELRTFAASVVLTALPVLGTAPKLLGVSRLVRLFEEAGFSIRTVSSGVALTRQSYGVFYHFVQKMLTLDISAERVFQTLWEGQKLFDQQRNTFAFFLKLSGEAEGTVVIYSKGVLITVYKAAKLSAQRFIPVP